MNKHRLHRLKMQITQIFLLVISYWLSRMRLLLKRCFGIPTCFFVVILLSGLVTGCYAGPISSEELIENAKLYDGKEIVFQGEAIGDVMKRGNFSWVNILDGNPERIVLPIPLNPTRVGLPKPLKEGPKEGTNPEGVGRPLSTKVGTKNAVGIFFENSISCGIKFTGDYGHRGDIIEVNGIFNRACLEHGGDLDIHAIRIIKLKEGFSLTRKIPLSKRLTALYLAVILLFLFIIAIIIRIKKWA